MTWEFKKKKKESALSVYWRLFLSKISLSFLGEVEEEREISLAFCVSRMAGVVKEEGEEQPWSIWASSREGNQLADGLSDF